MAPSPANPIFITHSLLKMLFAWWIVEAHDDALELWARGLVTFHHQRIMAGNNVLRRRRRGTQLVKTLEHLTDMERRHIGFVGVHVLVEVRNVGRQNDPAAFGVYPHELESCRMAGSRMDRNPR